MACLGTSLTATNSIMDTEPKDYAERSLVIHEQLRGKIGTFNKLPVKSHDDLSIAYTPGVARPCEVIVTAAVVSPTAAQILPDPLNLSVAPRVAAAVSTAWEAEFQNTGPGIDLFGYRFENQAKVCVRVFGFSRVEFLA